MSSRDHLQIARTADGSTVYRLPRRPWDSVGVFGLVTMVPMLVIFTAIGVALLLVAAGQLDADASDGTRLGALLFALFWLTAMASVGYLAVERAFASTEITVADGQCYRRKRIGPLRWHKAIPIDSIRRLHLIRTAGRSGARHARRGDAGLEEAVLEAEWTDGSRVVLASRYPRHLLRSLAERLAQHFAHHRSTAVLGSELVRIVEERTGKQSNQLGIETPADNRIEAEEEAASQRLRVIVHPSGLVSGTGGTILALLLVVALFAAVAPPIVSLTLSRPGTHHTSSAGNSAGLNEPASTNSSNLATAGTEDEPSAGWSLYLLLNIIFFLATVLTMAVWTLFERTTRRVELNADADALAISQHSLFGSDRRRWSRDEVAAIEVGPASHGRHAEQQLQIFGHQGKPFGLLGDLDEPALCQTASRLQSYLGPDGSNSELAAARQPSWGWRSECWQPSAAIALGGLFSAAFLTGALYWAAKIMPPILP